ncbi:hypothetical protein M409DRAFT_24764 [Zasmidium cellare ATCC 36951]|uniref:Small secreted protein n=1 Tax=Zasmidium cellare ATCC 36951 TaxID=1080233 RepID=A0A6A6CGR0_ZASCE|nr:uncharacterized protein M409DRAFT_24764 [Zasmidium cellare ATCC 36951]KAF2164859.1 hypothetical protein M409DRAFT_24764 [Zasmidium cellare ATCC 36951]
MLTKVLTAFLLPLLVVAYTDPLLNNKTTPALNITAISAAHGSSVLECWQLEQFSVSNTPGTVGALAVNLGNASNATYSIIQGRTDAGLHNAPVPQLVYFATGLIRLSIPNTTQEAWVTGGKYGLIFAQDTPDKSQYGHLTEYVADEDTIALTVPLAPGQELKHKVLHSGGCTWREVAGL